MRAAQRVVVTGIGVVSNIGCGIAAFSEGLLAGRSGIAPIRSFDTTGFPHVMAGEVRDFDASRYLRRLDVGAHGRTSLFAAAAARMAVDDAGIAPEQLTSGRAGACVGTTAGESQAVERLTAEWLQRGPDGITAAVVPQIPASRLAVAVARELGLRGEAITLSTACSAGNYALGYGYDLIQTGQAEAMLCGGADSVCRWVHAGFYRLGAIAPLVCQPFDVGRQGILTSEGAGMLLLESLASAERRGARVYAEILGYGLTCDARHMVAPDPPSIAECIRRAHRHAGVRPEQVDYVCAHGTGTKMNDVVESAALREVFGQAIPPLSAIKSMIGHTMGAASALGAIACAVAIQNDMLPPTINVTAVDEECGVDCVPNQARPARVGVAQNNGFAFGGNNAVVMLGRTAWRNQHL